MGVARKVSENFRMDASYLQYFLQSQWSVRRDMKHGGTVGVGNWYLLYRFVYFGYFLAAISLSMFRDLSSFGFYFIYLTNQTLLIQFSYGAVYFWRLVWLKLRGAPDESLEEKKLLHWPEIVIWILQSLASLMPFFVTGIYWSILFSPDEFAEETTWARISDIVVHGTNLLWAIVDLLIIAIPCKISHMAFTATYALFYATFTGLYEIANSQYPDDNGYIYIVLDWKNHPGLAVVTCAGGLLFSTLGYFIIVFGFYKLRVALATRCTSLNSSNDHINGYAFENPIAVDDTFGNGTKGGGKKQRGGAETTHIVSKNGDNLNYETFNKRNSNT